MNDSHPTIDGEPTSRVGSYEMYFLGLVMVLVSASFHVLDGSSGHVPSTPTVLASSSTWMELSWDAPRVELKPLEERGKPRSESRSGKFEQDVLYYELSYCSFASPNGEPSCLYSDGWVRLAAVEYRHSFLTHRVSGLTAGTGYNFRVRHGATRSDSRDASQIYWGSYSSEAAVWTEKDVTSQSRGIPNANKSQKRASSDVDKQGKSSLIKKVSLGGALGRARMLTARTVHLSTLAFFGAFLVVLFKSQAAVQLQSILNKVFSLSSRRVTVACVAAALAGGLVVPAAWSVVSLVIFLGLTVLAAVTCNLLWWHCRRLSYQVLSNVVSLSCLITFFSTVLLYIVYPIARTIAAGLGTLGGGKVVALVLYAVWMVFMLFSIILAYSINKYNQGKHNTEPYCVETSGAENVARIKDRKSFGSWLLQR